jgi:hypothetical protein
MFFSSKRSIQLVIVISAGSIALVSLGIQPLWLGALASFGRIGEGAIGLLAMLEIIMIALASVAYQLSPWRIRDDASLVMAGAAMAFAHWATGQAETLLQLALLRSLAGVAQGYVVAITVTRISQAARPEFWTAIFLFAQTLAQIAMSLSGTVIAGADVSVTYWFSWMALLGSAIAISGVAVGKGTSQRINSHIGRPTRASLCVLASIAAYLATVGAIWTYADRMAELQGLSNRSIHVLTALALFTGLAASVVSIPLLTRIASRRAVWWSSAAMLISSLALFIGTPPVFEAALLVFGFFWIFPIPFQAQILMHTGNGSAMLTLMPLAQLGGTALGAVLAGAMVEVSGPFGSVAVAALMICTSTWLVSRVDNGLKPTSLPVM